MDVQLNGKVAVVTGASRGIGAAIARALAAEGVKVVVNYAGRKDRAEGVVAEIKEHGGQALAVQADVTIEKDVQRLFEATNKAFGRLDLVVNNAGIYEFEPITEVTPEKFHRHFNTNVLGPVLTTQQALHYFGEAGGQIINISSGASEHPEGDTALYSATKGALDVLTKALAKGLAGRNIRVNTIAPGVMENEVVSLPGSEEYEFEQQIIGQTPLGRLGKGEDIGKAVVLLAAEAAGWMTGVRLNVSGGLFL